ncbi:MAG: hypothetical protein KDD83_21695, partial [Caldilineaceae bacterium]|nr:hypothetical protein [Caldilineaceae bacterium]
MHAVLQRRDLVRATSIQDIPARQTQGMRLVRLIGAGQISREVQRVETCVLRLTCGHEFGDGRRPQLVGYL